LLCKCIQRKLKFDTFKVNIKHANRKEEIWKYAEANCRISVENNTIYILNKYYYHFNMHEFFSKALLKIRNLNFLYCAFKNETYRFVACNLNYLTSRLMNLDCYFQTDNLHFTDPYLNVKCVMWKLGLNRLHNLRKGLILLNTETLVNGLNTLV